MEKFFVAIGVQGLDIEKHKGFNPGGQKSGKCSTREEAEKWAEAQVAAGMRCTFVILEAVSLVKPRDVPFVKEDVKFTAIEHHPQQNGADLPENAYEQPSF